MKSEVTRKNDVYAFATSTSRPKNSVRVCACQMPIAAKSVPSATSVTRSARGSQSAIGLRATVARPATNGNTKNASVIPPARSSHVQRNDVEARGHERGERQREQERGRGRSLTAQDPVREREHGGGDDEVEREEQERLVVAQLYGHAERCNCEECDGNRRRVARERHGADDRRGDADRHERDSSGIFQEELHVVVADEGPREAAGGHPEEPEPGEREDAAARDQREHGAERSDERRDLGELGVLHRPRRYATSD